MRLLPSQTGSVLASSESISQLAVIGSASHGESLWQLLTEPTLVVSTTTKTWPCKLDTRELEQWSLFSVWSSSWLLALSYLKYWCMLSYLVLVEVTISLKRQGVVFWPWHWDLGIPPPSMEITMYSLKASSLPSCLKEKNRSCLRGLGFGSTEVVSANQEGGK